VQVLVGDRYFHAQVTEVTNQDTVEVSIKGAAPMAATRLAGPPRWQVNRFEA
jgi:hypothetical protein